MATFSDVYNKTHIPPGESYDIEGGTCPGLRDELRSHGKPDLRGWQLYRHRPQTDPKRCAVDRGAFQGIPGLWRTTLAEPDLPRRRKPDRRGRDWRDQCSSSIIDPYGRLVALDVNKDGSEVDPGW